MPISLLPVMTPPLTVFVPFSSFNTHRPSALGVNLCAVLGALSISVRLPMPTPLEFFFTSITGSLSLPVICRTWPFKSSVTVRVTVRELLMLMSPASLTVLTVESAIAAVSSSAVRTSFTVSPAAGVAPSPLNAVKAVSGWGSDTSPSGCTAAASAGWAYLAQFSGKAPSAPQTGQSVFMFSTVQAVSQMQTGGSSALSSAKAAVGIRHSSIHRASRVLNMRFFILLPPFRRLLTA